MAVARNSAEVAWPGATGAAIGETGAWLGVWTALTGGSFLFGVQLSNSPMMLENGEVYYIAAMQLAITQTAAANEVEASAQNALRGRLGGIGPVPYFWAVHTADPGTTGANQLPALARVSLAHSTFAYTDT